MAPSHHGFAVHIICRTAVYRQRRMPLYLITAHAVYKSRIPRYPRYPHACRHLITAVPYISSAARRYIVKGALPLYLITAHAVYESRIPRYPRYPLRRSQSPAPRAVREMQTVHTSVSEVSAEEKLLPCTHAICGTQNGAYLGIRGILMHVAISSRLCRAYHLPRGGISSKAHCLCISSRRAPCIKAAYLGIRGMHRERSRGFYDASMTSYYAPFGA